MTPHLEFKPGVTLGDPPTACQVRILATYDRAARLLGQSLTVTCGREGHPDADPHTKGLALDVRSVGLPDASVMRLYEFVRSELGPAFTVLYEVPTRSTGILKDIETLNPSASGPHLHQQPVKGTIWPMP